MQQAQTAAFRSESRSADRLAQTSQTAGQAEEQSAAFQLQTAARAAFLAAEPAAGSAVFAVAPGLAAFAVVSAVPKTAAGKLLAAKARQFQAMATSLFQLHFPEQTWTRGWVSDAAMWIPASAIEPTWSKRRGRSMSLIHPEPSWVAQTLYLRLVRLLTDSKVVRTKEVQMLSSSC